MTSTVTFEEALPIPALTRPLHIRNSNYPQSELSEKRFTTASYLRRVQRVVRDIYSLRYARLRTLLSEARKSAGLTQVNLARRLQRPQSFIANVERGERHVDVVEYLSIVEAIGLAPTVIIEELALIRDDG